MKNAKKTLTLPILLIFLVVVAMLVVHAFSFSTLKVNALEISQAIKKTTDTLTYVSGVIDTNTIWTIEKSPYIVTGDIRVSEVAMLTIEPGVTVKFAGNYYMEIRGVLQASGTSPNLITFTSNSNSPQAGDWVGIRNYAYEAQSYPYVRSKGNITIHYCVIEYATIGVRGSLENDGEGHETDVTISNSMFVKNGLGIYFTCREYSNSYARISNNTVISNGEGISINNRYYSPTLIVEDNTVALNTGNGLSIGGDPYPGGTLVRRNVFTKNGGTGISIQGAATHSQSYINLTQNYVTSNEIGIYVSLSPFYTDTLAIVNISENDLHRNTQYDLKVGTSSSYTLNHNATYNYWGTTNTTLIAQYIYDYHDNWDLAKVDYNPILQTSLETRSTNFYKVHVRTLRIYTAGVSSSEPVTLTKDGLDVDTVHDGNPLDVTMYRAVPADIGCDDIRIWSSNQNTRFKFINWTGPAVNNTNNPITVTLIMNRSITVFYKTQHLTNFTFKDNSRTTTLYTTPTQVQAMAPNGSLVTFTSYSDQWLDNGTWTLKQVMWQSNNVKPSIDPTYTSTPRGTWTINCRVYLISFSNSFKDSNRNDLYTLPSSFKLTSPNGTASAVLNPNLDYYIQNGTTTWSSIIWQGTEVCPSNVSFDPINGNPTTNCMVYSLTVDPIFYDNTGTVIIQPSSWSILFPNGTARTVSSPVTYNQTQTGNYSIVSTIWKETEVVPDITPTTSLTFGKLWSPNINCLLPTSISIYLGSSTSYVGFKVEINGNLTCSEVGLSGAPILLSYSVTGGESWNAITSVITASDGDYSAVWMPSATGSYLIRATWSGNATYPGTATIINLAVTEFEEQHVFSVESNSTISELAFNTTDWTLSFTATGPNGTRGYVKVTVAKSLVANIANMRVYLNDNQTEFSATSTDDSWLLTFNYIHSAHQVIVDLDINIVPEFPLFSITAIFMIATLLAVIVYRRKYSKSVIS